MAKPLIIQNLLDAVGVVEERLDERVKQVNKLEAEKASLLCLVEELANEFMQVSSNHVDPMKFVGNEPYESNQNRLLADKVNKALGLVK